MDEGSGFVRRCLRFGMPVRPSGNVEAAAGNVGQEFIERVAFYPRGQDGPSFALSMCPVASLSRKETNSYKHHSESDASPLCSHLILARSYQGLFVYMSIIQMNQGCRDQPSPPHIKPHSHSNVPVGLAAQPFCERSSPV